MDKRRASIDERAVRQYTRCFRVLRDNVLDGSRAARESPGIPFIGEFYTDGGGGIDIGARCRSVTAEQDDAYPTIWIVTAEYGSGLSDGTGRGSSGGGSGGPGSGSSQDPAQVKENPLERPAEITWGVTDYKRVVTKARLISNVDGTLSPTEVPIRNSAGARYDPAPEIDDSRIDLTIVRNEATFNQEFAFSYQNVVNDATFFGMTAGAVRCQGITAQSRFENNYYFWVVTYKFQASRWGWDLELPDAGTFEIDADGNPVVFVDGSVGHTVGEPLLLNGEGERLPDGDTEVYFKYRVYDRVSFAPLNLE